MNKLFVCPLVAVAAFATFAQTPKTGVSTDREYPVETVQAHRVALIVQNHSDSKAVPMAALADTLTAELSRHGFQVINPHNVIGVTQNRTAAGEQMPGISAVDLARKVGAEGAITASVTDCLDSTIGTPAVFHRFSVCLSFSLADARTGATICGEALKKESPKYSNNQVEQNSRTYWSELLRAAAGECAGRLERAVKEKKWQTADVRPKAGQSKDAVVLNRLAKTVAKLGEDVQRLKAEVRKLSADAKMEKVKTSVLTVSDLDGAVQKLMAGMREDENYRKNYDKAMKKMNRVPIVVVGGIKDETGGADGHPGITNLLAAVRVGVRVSLFKSGLFEVKDDDAGVALANRIIDSGKSPLEDKELMSALEGHGSPDFYFLGDLRYFGEEKKYRLRLALHSLLTGKIVWEDTIDK